MSSSQLTVSVGQYSDKGRKAVNQDFHGLYAPGQPQLASKGIAIALADGISSSEVSQIASQAAITGFLEDYYCTSEAWSVKKSVQRVLTANNAWLYAQTRQSQYCYEKDKGYVCTLSALVLKSATAHIFHVGDSRIYRLQGHDLEQLTNDHRLWVSNEKSYLSRAMGMDSHLEIDYHSLSVEIGDSFILATDGVYEYVSPNFVCDTINNRFRGNLDAAAKAIADEAYRQGSTDNLTIQIIKIETLPTPDSKELYQSLTELPFPPLLEARMQFDGYTITRELHASSRSHVYLAVDQDTQTPVVLKTPSIDLRGDPAYLERFLMEDWIARRINNPHVLKPYAQTRKRHYLYITTEFIDGQTLKQWMLDHPQPDMETVRDIVEQIAKGLRAFHRLEMLHQDLRPDNIMIDSTGTVKIIDFGSTRVAGLVEMNTAGQDSILGTAQYTAPEYFIGEPPTARSDMFSLGVITYQMLIGKLPYGAEVAKCRTKATQSKLMYATLLQPNRLIPAWVDDAVKKAVHPNPYRRYEDLSEFIFNLRHPHQAFLNKTRPPLLERNPVGFWKGVSCILALIIVALLLK
ncbi:MAG: bifunctional protein-serine/threonine kinase/phosphatase [Methylomonas sp.]|jgi:serine/threonine protein kinase|uniref:bifunctional protein-serine/threonine kinase/phosphatase n=1 Tax=Methylomonas sp. TaxID=418 RepID=UPI0025D6032D|nr:bifunctional protein-serine/threonine kinase/phosphatase [Methylomonas sp.]MCK9608545.1 bifunctional protein-serine/threonine kinase/phosphatase [Methylomonas sp.]